jgi:hypothetical protein
MPFREGNDYDKIERWAEEGETKQCHTFFFKRFSYVNKSTGNVQGFRTTNSSKLETV